VEIAAPLEMLSLASPTAAWVGIVPAQLWVPRGYATSTTDASVAPAPFSASAVEQGVDSAKLTKIIKGAADFALDNNTFTEAKISATFYPKFENEKSDQEVGGH
jgi:hypothetical protein